jgi:superoxide dismutase, Cu-Zn family
VAGYGISVVTEGPHSLCSDGRTAIIVHGKADDNKTDPFGNSGDGIVCGVISN